MLLIDTYNVLHVTGVLPPHLAGLDVPAFVQLLGRSRYARQPTTLVCDGGGSRNAGVRMGRVHLLFSGRAAEADDLIETLIDRYATGRTLTVVSSDRRLVRAARRRGARAVPSPRFLAELVEDDRRAASEATPILKAEIPLDRLSVAHWLREFGLEPSIGSPATTNPPTLPTAPQAPPGASTSAEKPPPAAPARDRPRPAAADNPPADPVELDPLLRHALEEWRGRLTADDLDMAKWIDDVTPHRRPPPPDG